MQDRIRLLGLLFIVYHVFTFTVFAGIGVTLLVAGVITASDLPADGDEAALVLSFVALSLLYAAGTTIFGVVAGWGLIRLQRWGRILALIVAFFMLFNFPLGTVLGLFAFVTLLNDEADSSFGRLRYHYGY